MGRLLHEQHSEAGRAVAGVGAAITILLLTWGIYTRDPAIAPGVLGAIAVMAAGLVFAKSGHRLYEHGVETFSMFRTTQLRHTDVHGGTATRVRFLMVGIHTRTTYHVSLTTTAGATLRFQHIAPAGRELAIEEFLRQCGVAVADTPDRRFRGST